MMRTQGYSFCIISGGKRHDKLDQLINSIQRQNWTQYEIIVAGAAKIRPGITYLPLEHAAEYGRTNLMRNSAAARSKFSHIVFCDDDIILTAEWLTEVNKCSSSDLLSTRLLNLDGTRHWDWATSGGPRGLSLLDYTESDSYVYLPGGLMVMKANTWEQVRWDESLGYGQAEDVVISRTAQKHGFRSAFCFNAIGIHNDHTYTQIGRKVPRRSTSASETWRSNSLRSSEPGELGLRAVVHLKAKRLTDGVDCLRHALYLLPSYSSAALLLDKIERGCGGPINSGNWQPTPLRPQ